MLTGHCLCGGVRYEISGEPLARYYCHCSQCRRASGSAFAANVLVRSDDFKLVDGEAVLASYESTPGKRRFFCSRCGSPVFNRTDAIPQLVPVRCGTLDGDPGLPASSHIWVDSKAPWFEISDDLPQRPEALTSAPK